MRILKECKRRVFWQSYGVIISVGLSTALAILLFETVNLLVLYRYIKLDYYLCLVAIFFLATGLKVSQGRTKVEEKSQNVAKASDSGALIEGTASELVVSADKKMSEVLAQLSSKEWLVLKLVSEGKTNKEIAAIQFIAISTVKTHLNNVYGKLSVTNRKEARVKYAEMSSKWPSG